MTALLVSPDYVSHYLPLSAVGSALRGAGREVVVATGPGLRERVLADGFGHVELRLGSGRNARPETDTGDPGTRDFLAATYGGMVETLAHQARRRLHDLLWEPERVTSRLAVVVDEIRPELVLSDQLAFGASLALRALGVPYTAFLPGHPCQLPPPGQPFGYPARRPAGLAEEHELAALRALCEEAARAFTRRFNDTLLELAPDAQPVESAFGAIAPRGTLVNYPRSLARSPVAPGVTLVRSCVREEPNDPELDAPERNGSRAYVALGSFLSARSDVLREIAGAIRSARLHAVIASGVTPPADLGVLPPGSVVRPYLPQVAALRACDVAICHGGNNTAMEALTAGLPVVALPFSTDQFAVAADLVDSRVGVAVDPNHATADDVAAAIRLALSPATRARAAAVGQALRREPGQERAASLLLGTTLRRTARVGGRGGGDLSDATTRRVRVTARARLEP
jgi:MGT family glycosyltransferase